MRSLRGSSGTPQARFRAYARVRVSASGGGVLSRVVVFPRRVFTDIYRRGQETRPVCRFVMQSGSGPEGSVA